MMSKQAQIQQIFTYLTTIFVIGAIAVIGAQSLFGIMDQNDQVQYITFKENVKQAIEDNNVYGTVNEKTFSTPSPMRKLCLVDKDVLATRSSRNSFNANTDNDIVNYVIEDSVHDGVKANMFLTDGNHVISIGYSRKLTTSQDMVCINSTNGHFTFKLEGQGRTTHLSNRHETIV